MRKTALCIFITLSCLINLASRSHAQDFTQDEIKAAFIFSFAKYVTWTNETGIHQFHIGIIGTKKNFDIFSGICAGRKLKDAQIVITHIKDIDNIPAVHVLCVNNENCAHLAKIIKAVKQNTLIVSDNCNAPDDIMINFTDNDPERKFELNIKNILFADLEISKKIVTLGGGQDANWKDLFIKTDKELDDAKHILAYQKEEIKKQQKILYEKAELIRRQENEINKREKEIKKKKKEISDQTHILSKQKGKIAEQEKVLTIQLEKIEFQRMIMYLFILIGVMFAGLAFFIFRGYRIKKRANLLLEAKNKEINRQKTEIEKQAHELEIKNVQLEKLSIVASKTDNSVVIFSKTGELEWVNDGFRRMTGYSLEEFKREFGSSIFQASANPKIKKLIEESIEKKKSVIYTVKNKTKWGNEIWVQTTLTPILNEFGDLSRLVTIDADVTQIKLQEERIREQKRIIEIEKDKSEKLLLNILPEVVANDLKKTGKTLPEVFENVTVYFSDVVGFTKMSTSLNPQLLINELNDIFTEFDNIIERNDCERIKTIGDAYLMVCGMPREDPNHAENVLRSAISIIRYLRQRNENSKINWEIRIGIHTGKVVGGVVGIKKYIYDVFGDTINTASRMESSSQPMMINVSETTYRLVQNKFMFVERDLLEVKGKGTMRMYFVDEKHFINDISRGNVLFR
ncbi:MAG: DUF4154 domain-containing protein [Bacteroidetes bacterium]|nr:DUF4154 domain-containing protein [Bacteroidota bacterium]